MATEDLQSVAGTIIFAGSCFFILEYVFGKLLRARLAKMMPHYGPKADDYAIQIVARLVGSVHNFIQIPLAITCLLNSDLQQDRIYASVPVGRLLVRVSAGYFLHDLIVCAARVHLEGPFYLLHAICSFSVFAYGVYSDCLQYYGAAAMLWEISTIFVHMRWIMVKLRMDDKPIYIYNGLLMIVAFGVVRIIWGTYTAIRFWLDSAVEIANPRPDGFSANAVYLYRFSNWALMGLNYFWFYAMVKRAYEILVKGISIDEARNEKDD